MINILNMRILNFKGLRDLYINFSEKVTNICGGNGTGKTSVADAFTWLLFGKDSLYRTAFNVKTLDEKGKEISHLEHLVEAELDVNGKTMKLGRSLVEKWSKQKGELEPTYDGNTTNFYINEVRVSKKEFETMIDSLIQEQTFKMITNPYCFPSLKAEQQKEMLFRMAGELTDQDVAKGNEGFTELLSAISGTTLETYKKEIAQKKRKCSDELKGIPGRIEENKNKLPNKKDWTSIEADAEGIKLRITSIDEQIADRSKGVAEAYKEKETIQNSLSTAMIQRNGIVNKVREDINRRNNELNSKINTIQYKVDTIDRDIENRQKTISSLKEQLAFIPERLQLLRDEYRAIYAEQLQYDETKFVCPTCHRAFETEDIEAKKAEMSQNFNDDKANRIKANQAKGKGLTVQIEELNGKINAEENAIEGKMSERSTLINEITKLNAQTEHRAAEDIAKENQTYVSLTNEITQFENQLKIEVKPVDVSDLNSKKRELSTLLDGLKEALFERTVYNNTLDRISELEELQKAQAQELARLEKIEFTILEFEKAKDNMLAERINNMFQLVKFKFFTDQIKGDGKITCECTVDGVPYSDLNTAKKVNAGLDIINAICKRYNVGAPIFIDNRESVNELIDTESQIINLVVSKDQQLTIN